MVRLFTALHGLMVPLMVGGDWLERGVGGGGGGCKLNGRCLGKQQEFGRKIRGPQKL